MARISTYIKDSVVTGEDFVIGSDGDNLNRTSQFSVDALATYINRDTSKVYTTRLLYGYDGNGDPDLFDDDGNVTQKYAGADDQSIPDGSLDGADDPGPFPGGSPERPPYFEVKHNLRSSAVDVLLYRLVPHTPETSLWTSSNTSQVNGFVPNTTEMDEDRYSPYIPVGGVFIIDDNTIHIDFNNFELYDVQVVVLGSENPMT